MSGLQCKINLVFLLVLIQLSSTRSLPCTFPDFVQFRTEFGPEVTRHWQGKVMAVSNKTIVKRQLNEQADTFLVRFYGHVMSATRQDPETREEEKRHYFTRECVRQVQLGKYLVKHRPREGDHKYLCVHFIPRNKNTLQTLVSGYSKFPFDSLCDKLEFSPFPLVNRDSILSANEECPLTGGFTFKVSDSRRKRNSCLYENEFRIESDCSTGEGMTLYFHDRDCVPIRLRMHAKQPLFCIGSWDSDEYTFTVLSHPSKNHQWCLRIPKLPGDSFTAVLFKDLVCELDPINSLTTEHLILDVERDSRGGKRSLCEDVLKSCNNTEWGNPCSDIHSSTYLGCPKTCGICNEERPKKCLLPRKLQGRWIEGTATGKEVLKVDHNSVSMPEIGKLTCTDWGNSQYDVDSETIEQMFVADYDNGCSPRYNCVRFQKRTPSVLRFKVSQSKLSPFKGSESNEATCKSFHYNRKLRSNGDEPNYFKTLVAKDNRVYVDCKQTDKIFDVTFKDGTICSGRLTQTRRKMIMSLENCPGKEATQVFACLDSMYHGYVGDHTLLTESSDQKTGGLHCWMFPISRHKLFYLLPASECNEGTREKIRSQQVFPLAIFQERIKVQYTMQKLKPVSASENTLLRSVERNTNWGIQVRSEQDIDTGDNEVMPVYSVESAQSVVKPETGSLNCDAEQDESCSQSAASQGVWLSFICQIMLLYLLMEKLG